MGQNEDSFFLSAFYGHYNDGHPLRVGLPLAHGHPDKDQSADIQPAAGTIKDIFKLGASVSWQP
jgi:hypothetical protein